MPSWPVACGRLSAPVDNLLSNWAYMVATALAWNLKSWWALWLPETGRWHDKHAAEKTRILGMEFKTFLNAFIKIPCQIIRAGRQLVYRVLNYNPQPAGVLPHGKRTALLRELTPKPESGCSGPPPRLTAPKCNRVPQ